MIDWRIYERDVDIVLAEEFYANESFGHWFLGRANSFANVTAKVLEVRVSLSGEKGESDLVVIFEKPDKSRFALLIEDKIDAVFQPDQVDRYRLRGKNGIDQNMWQEFSIILCAPRSYIEKHESAAHFDSQVPYEEIAKWFRSEIPGRRGEYRAAFLDSATPRGASAYVKQTDPETDKFWNAAYELATREFPELEMKKPNYASQTTWVLFWPKFFPSQVSVDLKARVGIVDLTFSAVPVNALYEVAKDLIPNNATITKAGASAVIRSRIPEFSVVDGSDIISTKVRIAFDRCREFVRFYRENEAQLAQLVRRDLPQ